MQTPQLRSVNIIGSVMIRLLMLITVLDIVHMMASSSMFSSLPTEVLDAIVQDTSKADQLSLSPTSKLLNAVVTRRLYRDINLRSHAQTVRCCKTLISNANASASTRKIAFPSVVL